VKAHVEINCKTAKICFPVTQKAACSTLDAYILLAREGCKKPIAKYAGEQSNASSLCFFIDDAIRTAKPGWYVGTIYSCEKPISSVRMRVARPQIGQASVVEFTHSVGEYGCTKSTCPPDNPCDCKTCKPQCKPCDDLIEKAQTC
jgi:hypothetical protein